ncbi:MAG TPA: sulfatase-like hydrolase/transferase [Polyangiaceae bacterium]|nr:sulfatase-like hydrolase/transferase [Polyangiaceae bacterium]
MADAPLAIPFARKVARAASAGRVLAGAAPWTLSAAGVASVALGLVLFAFQRRALSDLLALSANGTPGPDPWLFPAILVSSSLALLAPSWLVAAAWMLAKRPVASRRSFIAIASLTLLLALLDLDLLRSIGRHLAEIAQLAFEPHGHVAGGGLWGWVVVVLRWAAIATVATALLTRLSQALVDVMSRYLTRLLRAVLAVAGATAMTMAIAAPVLLLSAWGNHAVVERLYASMPIDIRPIHGEDGAGRIDPRLAGLYARLQSSYKAAFPALTSGRPGDTHTLTAPARPPNVVLIVTESFRHDAFGPELMPRMSRWSEGGLVATRHDAGTIYSQSGAFALMYGRSPAVYHQTLDAQVPPQFCTTLRSAGYECDYYTGHPVEWMRREEFLSGRTMDHFIHDDRDDWPDWDRRALDNMVQRMQTSDKPVFAIVLLMSSHFEYRYPPQYEIDRPVANTAWLTTMVSALGPEAEVPHRNRYRNCMRFLDDLVSDAIGRLDPARNLIIFTGDHGESINDDGRYTHGYSFAEILTRTPFAMVGPGVAPSHIDWPTSHVDVLPSTLHALTGSRPQLDHVHGVDWFAGEAHASLLEAHSRLNKQVVETQLRVGGHRLRLDLDLTRPALSLLGFEDDRGKLLPPAELSESEVDEIARAFEEQLSILRR